MPQSRKPIAGKRLRKREKPSREETYRQIGNTTSVFMKAMWDADLKPELLKVWQFAWAMALVLVITVPWQTLIGVAVFLGARLFYYYRAKRKQEAHAGDEPPAAGQV